MTKPESDRPDRPAHVLLAAALPPPRHGQSAATEAVARALSGTRAQLHVHDTSPRTSDRGSLRYHLNRIRSVIRASWAIVGFHGPREQVTIYSVVESGLGTVYGLLILLAARVRGYALVLHHHTARHTLQRSALHAALFRLCHAGVSHVALCPGMARDLRQHYGIAGAIQVVDNAAFIPEPAARPSAGEASSALVLGMIAGLTVEKGVPDAIDLFLRTRHDEPSVRLLLAGPVLDDRLHEPIDRARREAGAPFETLGEVSGERKLAFFQSIDVLLLPSRYRNEATPLVLLEALAHGRPCLTTSCGYIEDWLADMPGVFICPPGEDFVSFGLRLMDGAWRQRWRSAAARAAIAEAFRGRKAMAEQQLAVLVHRLTHTPQSHH